MAKDKVTSETESKQEETEDHFLNREEIRALMQNCYKIESLAVVLEFDAVRDTEIEVIQAWSDISELSCPISNLARMIKEITKQSNAILNETGVY